jgi:hypothetical protein
MQNLTENVKVGGVFICTTFDGERLFERLRGVVEGDSWSVYGSGVRGGERLFQITKRYSETGFPSDEMGLGYGVDVYQESINKTFREYLVHPEFLKNVMFDYGFTLVRREEAEQMGFARGTDTFDALHNTMLRDTMKSSGGGWGGARGGFGGYGEYGMAEKMSREEKEISFLNRYYIFRKRHAVDAGEVLKQRRKQTQAEGVWMKKVVDEVIELGEDIHMVEEEKGEKKGEEKGEKKKTKFRKVAAVGKIVLGDYSPIDKEEEKAVEKEPAVVAEEKAVVVAEKETAVVEEKAAVVEEKAVEKVGEIKPKKKSLRTTKKKQ